MTVASHVGNMFAAFDNKPRLMAYGEEEALWDSIRHFAYTQPQLGLAGAHTHAKNCFCISLSRSKGSSER